MNIKFTENFKSITPFEWPNIPKFVVITGPNGTGKSQLLELIYNTITNKEGTTERVVIIGDVVTASEVTYLKGEWQLQNTNHVDLSTLQQQMNTSFSQFQNPSAVRRVSEQQIIQYATYQDVQRKAGKTNKKDVTLDEFRKYFPEVYYDHSSQISLKIGEIFYNYRLSEIELKAEGKDTNQIKSEIGEKPWTVLRDILRQAKLPFEINDPSTNGIKDSFKLTLTHTILNKEVPFSDLSSGEKVLISTMFYLYNSQEKNVFPKFLLLDEPDAHLHPSMCQQFLNVVKNVLVDKFGVRVIMTTHSPSTIMLSPEESIFEMSRTDPRIKKSSSKNQAVSLLTAGLVYVGDGSKYFLVEDEDDVKFYTHIYNVLKVDKHISADIPLIFISASTKDRSGGKSVVENWVGKLQNSGLNNIIQGLIDKDDGNLPADGVFVINRYSIENYLVDPITLFAALMGREENPVVPGINLNYGDENKINQLPQKDLQNIADTIISKMEEEMKVFFEDFDSEKETVRVPIKFLNGTELLYPEWLIKRRGKTILNQLCNKLYSNKIANYNALFNAMRKVNMMPSEWVTKFEEMKT